MTSMTDGETFLRAELLPPQGLERLVAKVSVWWVMPAAASRDRAWVQPWKEELCDACGWEASQVRGERSQPAGGGLCNFTTCSTVRRYLDLCVVACTRALPRPVNKDRQTPAPSLPLSVTYLY